MSKFCEPKISRMNSQVLNELTEKTKNIRWILDRYYFSPVFPNTQIHSHSKYIFMLESQWQILHEVCFTPITDCFLQASDILPSKQSVFTQSLLWDSLESGSFGHSQSSIIW
jgi:hypothetical protein